MRRTIGWAAAATILATLAIAPTAIAKDGDVEVPGTCTGPTRSELDLSYEDGGIEVEFEVDQNVSGDRWRVKIRHDGDLAFRGTRTTRGASGSFEVRTVEPNRSGSDAFRARARNLSTGEVCVGRASI